ncbi:MAG: hypothetical protein H8E71_06870 [Candidatus Marinimicrobia bacterium]|nr:hypothetical protein [Candidatus Neomarinimicrobiota bacterium]MBL7109699.1 hypothetical protein [Candidatus Neomarinimicrobiota bacterium]
MKQHTSPIIIKDKTISTLEKVSLSSKEYNEDWIQDICYRSPNLLPVEEIEPTFAGMIPICRELTIESGSIDLVYVNEFGFVTIGECKLWRNPEARRKVVGQILDYAKDLAKWDYSKFEKECLKARKENKKSLFEIIQEFYPEIEEASFIDNLQNNLKIGRFLLTIIGDGIRGNMEELANYIHRNGNLNFTLGLIELPVYKNSMNEELIVTPRVLAKTKEIERIVYRFAESEKEESKIKQQEKTVSKSVSEKVFFERLQKSIGIEKSDTFQKFIDILNSEFNITAKLGRGKRLSLNLKSANDTYNFASIQENGEVWFYGIVPKTEELGDKQIGVEYLNNLAKIVNGKFDDSYKKWQWCVKRNEKFINITEYLQITTEWIKLISETLDKIYRLEENE